MGGKLGLGPSCSVLVRSCEEEGKRRRKKEKKRREEKEEKKNMENFRGEK
jgi:hypothetical protein